MQTLEKERSVYENKQSDLHHAESVKWQVLDILAQLENCDIMIWVGTQFRFKEYIHMVIWAATLQNQQSDCAPSEDSDQPGHPSSLIKSSLCT